MCVSWDNEALFNSRGQKKYHFLYTLHQLERKGRHGCFLSIPFLVEKSHCPFTITVLECFSIFGRRTTSRMLMPCFPF